MTAKRRVVGLIVAGVAAAQLACESTLTAPGVPDAGPSAQGVRREHKQTAQRDDSRTVERAPGRTAPQPGEAPVQEVGGAPKVRTEQPGARMASQGGVSALHSPNTTPIMDLRTQPRWVPDNPFPSISGPAPLTVKFNLCRSSDPDEETPDPVDGHLDSLNWQFHFGDDDTEPFNPDGSFNANVAHNCRTEHTYGEGTFTATVSVTDKHLHDQSGGDVVRLARTTLRLTIDSGAPPAAQGPSLPRQPRPGPFTAPFNDPTLVFVPEFTPGCGPSAAPDHYGLLTYGNRSGVNQTVTVTLDPTTCSGGGLGLLIALYQDGTNPANPSPFDQSAVCTNLLNTGYVLNAGPFTVEPGVYQVLLYSNTIGGTCSAGVLTTITTSP